jgi:hypothetical protein
MEKQIIKNSNLLLSLLVNSPATSDFFSDMAAIKCYGIVLG